MSEYGAETAFRRTLPFDEAAVLKELLPYLKKTLNLTHAEVLAVDEARAIGDTSSQIVDSSEPGAPGFEYYNI